MPPTQEDPRGLNDMFRRDPNNVGETLINVAIGLMREVRDEVKALRAEIADINKERREEAKESGSNRAEIVNIKRRLDNNDKLTIGLIIAVMGQLIWEGMHKILK